jgi:glycosyltransferase involved in cell wall biosynthesis
MNLLLKFWRVWTISGPKNALIKTFRFLRWKLVYFFKKTKSAVPSTKPFESNEILSLFETLDQSTLNQSMNHLKDFKSKMTPVLHLVQNFDAGGLERFVLDLALDLTLKGQRIVIGFTKNGGRLERESKDLGLEVYDFSDANDLLDFIKAQGVKVCFLHHAYEHLDGSFLNVVDVIEVIHNPYWWQVDNRQLNDYRKNMKALVCVSSYVKKYAIDILKVDDKLATVIPNTVRVKLTDQFDVKLKGPSIFLNVANFAVQKNQLLLILAFEAYCNETENFDDELWIVGHNVTLNLAGRIEKIFARSRRLRVKFLVAENEGALDEIYREADYFILPSTFEGFSLASLEAAQHGLAMALSCCGGFSELTSDYPNLVQIDGITPTNRTLTFDYIQETCWEPSFYQIQLVKNAFHDLKRLGSPARDSFQVGSRDKMLESYLEMAGEDVK